MKKGILHARIPTLFGFLILFASLWFTLFSLRDRITITSRAGPDTVPHNIEITNVSDESISISFITTQPTKGYISFNQTDGSTDLILDDRDKSSGNAKEYSSHLITVNRLAPETEYSFKLIVNGKEYLNNGNPFIVKTLRKLNTPPPSQNPIFGKILRPDGSIANDALVVLKVQNAGTISVLTNDNGEYLVPTNSLRNSNQEYFNLAPQNEIVIQAFWQNLISELKTTYSNSSSLPTITLSNEYDFVDKYQLTQSGPTGELSLDGPTSLTSDSEFSITVPTQNETFVDKRPQLRGGAPANSQITLIVDSTSVPITANASGAWTYRPPSNLAQGLHTITLQGTSEEGKSVRVTRNFEIFPEGSQVVESATPSATPRISPTPTRTPTPTTPIPTPTPTSIQPTPTIIPSVTITPSPTPTMTPSATPNFTPTPTSIASPSATISMIPPESIPAGSNYTLLGLIFSGFIIAAGTLLFLLL